MNFLIVNWTSPTTLCDMHFPSGDVSNHKFAYVLVAANSQSQNFNLSDSKVFYYPVFHTNVSY